MSTVMEDTSSLLTDGVKFGSPLRHQPGTESNEPDHKPKTWAELFPDGVNWPIAGWIILLHLGALAAPWTFTWQGLCLALVFHWFSGGIGVCLGYHRLFTHSSFKTYRPVRYLLALIGGLSGEGSVLDWVANHRKHHAFSDKPGDPHSPHDGPWWSHMFWFAPQLRPEVHQAHIEKWVPDLRNDRGLRIVSWLFLPSHFILAATFLAAGTALGGWSLGISLLVWGTFFRTVLIMHTTWFVNSISHMWGYANYQTRDDSKNNWFVAIIAYGEGWHNNHHAYPRMANHGHRWWEIDVTYRTIRLMELVGLAWDVVDYRNGQEKKRSQDERLQSEPGNEDLDECDMVDVSRDLPNSKPRRHRDVIPA